MGEGTATQLPTQFMATRGLHNSETYSPGNAAPPGALGCLPRSRLTKSCLTRCHVRPVLLVSELFTLLGSRDGGGCQPLSNKRMLVIRGGSGGHSPDAEGLWAGDRREPRQCTETGLSPLQPGFGGEPGVSGGQPPGVSILQPCVTAGPQQGRLQEMVPGGSGRAGRGLREDHNLSHPSACKRSQFQTSATRGWLSIRDFISLFNSQMRLAYIYEAQRGALTHTYEIESLNQVHYISGPSLRFFLGDSFKVYS